MIAHSTTHLFAHRRPFARMLLLALMASTVGAVGAQGFPERPVRLIVGQQAGASTDTVARLIGQRLSERLGQPFIVENKPGAVTRVAMDAAIKAAPDGHTLGIANAVAAAFPLVLDNYSFLPGKDFAPISMLGRAPSFLAVRSSLPVSNVAEFIRYAKANNDKMVLGHGGIGSNPHISAVALAGSIGISPVQVVYKGNAPTAVALGVGEIDFAMLDYASVRGMVERGSVRLLAVSEPRRFSSQPNVPTGAEAGLTPDIEGLTVWFMLVAAPATPGPVLETLNRHVREVLSLPDVKERLLAMGIEAEPTTAAEAATFLLGQREKLTRLTRQLNISLKN
ncbi:Bug family tripartite tricarboxylate transporter substrate binding protein [Hydrogenophaga sp. ANAO-22]|uniref:Bug family tripartite tricarboxylate transporter substrate binding protein n=1 Tax=unclassified Hydrogenophaga TaxID=2610897 RepID=UPI0036D2EE9C